MVQVTDLGTRACDRCRSVVRVRRITVKDSRPVVVAMCLCDARQCQGCRKHTANPRSPKCVHCGRVF
jgi:hypothetical protein